MIDKYYKILGASEFDSDEVILEKYNALKTQYSNDRFLEGEAGNTAAKNLTELEIAFKEITSFRSQKGQNTSGNSLFNEIKSAIKVGDLKLAQEKLDLFDERVAEWHYYQSVIFYKKNWLNESKKQLEIASSMEPSNSKYKEALNKLNERVNSSTINPDWNKSGNSAYTNAGLGEETPQLGGDSCCKWCCDMLICNAILNCCCNCH